jgi:hypothetical protein
VRIQSGKRNTRDHPCLRYTKLNSITKAKARKQHNFGSFSFSSHLDPGIDLDKVQPFLIVHQEIYGPSVLVLCSASQLHHVPVQFRPQPVWVAPCWRHLDDLLVVPLDQAVPLPQVYEVLPAIPNDLHLDVAGGLRYRSMNTEPSPNKTRALELADLKYDKRLDMQQMTLMPFSPPHACLDDDRQPAGGKMMLYSMSFSSPPRVHKSSRLPPPECPSGPSKDAHLIWKKKFQGLSPPQVYQTK